MKQTVELVRALRRITKVVASDLGLDPVLHEVMRLLLRMVPADDGAVMLIDKTGQFLIILDSIAVPKWEVENVRFRVGEGVAGWVANHRLPCVVRDARTDARYRQVPGQRSTIRSLVCVPLVADGKTIGVLNLTNRRRAGAFGKRHVELLQLLADHVSLEVENNRLYELSISDGLTGLYNHRFILRRLREEVAEARRYRTPLSVVMADIDHFKRINDTHGHPVGDRVLVEMAQVLRSNMREADIVARFQGGKNAGHTLVVDGRQRVLH